VNLDKFLVYGAENELCVMADNSAVPNSRWYSGSGIYRYSWLYVSPKNRINFNGVYIKTESIQNGSALLRVETDIHKESGVQNDFIEHIVKDRETGEIAAKVKFGSEAGRSAGIEIKNPKIWDIDSPNLYVVTTNYYIGDQLSDTAETICGIRSFSIDSKTGFILNGRPLKLKGGCVHHDNGILGAASYVRSEERKIELLKKSGFNAVRTAHNPPAPAFLDACDRLGMIVMDEAFDQWRGGKTQFDYHVNFDSDWEHDLAGMVLRDRNHPSVFFWSIGNEIVEQKGESGAPETSKMLFETIKRYDDRPVGLAVMPYDKSLASNVEGVDSVVTPLDFVGYNYMHADYADHKAKYPGRVIIGTETVPKEIWQSWEATQKNPNVLGDFVWTSIDYLGEAGIGRVYYSEERPEIEAHLYDYPWNQAYCGDIDVCGFKRPQSYYRDILWGVSNKPKMFARRPSKYSSQSEKTTWWGWNDGIEGWDFDIAEGTMVTVDVYSPAAFIELFLNGESLGKKALEEFKASFEVPYKKGELKAADSNGCEAVLVTAKAPAKITLEADREKIGAWGDLSYVTVQIADADGKTVTNAENAVYFAVEGTGSLLAVGSSNPKSEEMYVGNTRRAYDGKLMVVVKSAERGQIRLTAISDGLEKAEICLTAG
jgi:beta-galactosidase